METPDLYIKTEPELVPCASTSSQSESPPVEHLEPVEHLCRLCGSIPERTVEIYSAEGISNELSDKINEYLPVKVSPEDKLPLCCCWNCVSTLISFHDLVISCVEAEKRLQCIVEEQPKPIPILIPPEGLNANSSEPNDEETEIMDEDTEMMEEDDEYDPENEEDDSEEEEEAESKPMIPGTSDDTEAMAEWDAASASLNAYSDSAISKKRETTEEVKTYDDLAMSKRWEPAEESVDEMFESAVKDEGGKGESAEAGDYKYLCEFCSAVFSTDEDAYAHVKSEHPNEITVKKQRKRHPKLDKEIIDKAKVVVDGKVYYNCKTCGKSLHSPYTYIWHMRIHTGERPYVCDLCGKQFRVSQGLVRHLKETHEGIKNYPCDLCGRMFATRRNVEEHRRIHTNERPYVCDLCGKAFKQKASLFVHNRSHTNHFPFRCSHCDQGFRTRPTLLIHVTRHTGEKPHSCDICGRGFRIKYELNRHKLIHSDVKPFKCEDCGIAFRQKRYLRNHMKINHNRELKS